MKLAVIFTVVALIFRSGTAVISLHDNAAALSSSRYCASNNRTSYISFVFQLTLNAHYFWACGNKAHKTFNKDEQKQCISSAAEYRGFYKGNDPVIVRAILAKVETFDESSFDDHAAFLKRLDQTIDDFCGELGVSTEIVEVFYGFSKAFVRENYDSNTFPETLAKVYGKSPDFTRTNELNPDDKPII